MESTLVALLKTVCTRTFPDVAPPGTVKPYITWQAIGGKSLRNLDNSAGDKRHTFMQINVWSASRLEANAMARQIEDVLCADSVLIASPEGEPRSDYEEDTATYGAIQRFSIYSSR